MKIKDLMIKIENNKNLIAKCTEENKEMSNMLIEKLSKKNVKNYIFESEESSLNATIVERNNVTFDLDVLKEKLGKSLYKEVKNKEIEVDKAELREIFRSNPDLKAKLKSALIVRRTLNESKLKKLIESGEIDKDLVKEACNITTSKYLRLERKYEENQES